MPIIALLILVAAIVIITQMTGKNLFGANRKKCRWKKDNFRANQKNQHYICLVCSVGAYTFDGKPPKECKRQFRDTQL